MKKRLRKKKQGCYFKKIDVEITSIESLEKDFNYIVTFKCYRPKYQIKAIDSRMCLCHCVSGKNFKKTG